jgi:hypothetical protein
MNSLIAKQPAFTLRVRWNIFTIEIAFSVVVFEVTKLARSAVATT